MSWNSVKRRSSQAASSRARPASPLGVVGGEGAGRVLGLVEQLLAVALRALDVVHHAVAAGEAVLQLGGDARQTIALVGDRLEEGLRRREDQLVAVEARGWR